LSSLINCALFARVSSVSAFVSTQKVFIADKISSVTAGKQFVFVSYRKGDLSSKRNLSILEFQSLGALVNCFEKSESEFAMHFHCGIYDCMALLTLLHSNLRKSAKSADYFAAFFSSAARSVDSHVISGSSILPKWP
jgi:hypothetical protein